MRPDRAAWACCPPADPTICCSSRIVPAGVDRVRHPLLPAAPEVIHQQVAGQGRDPCLEAAARQVEAGQISVNLQEDFLGEILGIVRRAGKAIAEACRRGDDASSRAQPMRPSPRADTVRLSGPNPRPTVSPRLVSGGPPLRGCSRDPPSLRLRRQARRAVSFGEAFRLPAHAMRPRYLSTRSKSAPRQCARKAHEQGIRSRIRLCSSCFFSAGTSGLMRRTVSGRLCGRIQQMMTNANDCEDRRAEWKRRSSKKDAGRMSGAWQDPSRRLPAFDLSAGAGNRTRLGSRRASNPGSPRSVRTASRSSFAGLRCGRSRSRFPREYARRDR